MGIFDFAKEGASKELGEKITKMLQDKGLDIAQLKVEVKDQKVAVSGTANSEKMHQKAIELIKGIEGVKGVEDDIKVMPKVEGSEVTEEGETVYTVKSGDTLWGISEKFYGDGSKYTRIFEANKEVWKDHNDDPNIIYPNWKLVIPPKEA